MTTQLHRKMVSLSGDTLEELACLLEDEKQKRKKSRTNGQFYESHLLAQLIHNEVVIRKAFGH